MYTIRYQNYVWFKTKVNSIVGIVRKLSVNGD